MFLYPPLSLNSADYDSYWKDKRGKDLGMLSDWQKARANFVLEALVGKGKSSFLDLGCGDGSILNYLKERGVVSHAIGIDTSNLALQSVKEFGFESIQADITDVAFLKDIPRADYAVLFEILEHIEHSEEMLKVVYDRMNNGLFFSFPNTGFFVHRLRLLFGRFPVQWRLYPGEHLRFWTARDLKWWLKALGYKDYQIFYYKGVPIINKIWPTLFAAGFVVLLKK